MTSCTASTGSAVASGVRTAATTQKSASGVMKPQAMGGASASCSAPPLITPIASVAISVRCPASA
ncbi:MAG: hypothetical protein ABSC25_17845 [Roseiarcus sp.]